MIYDRVTSGELRQRVTIQKATAAPAGGGGTIKTWSDVVTVRAKVEPLNGGEAFRQGMLNATQFYRVTIRFRTDVTAASRLVWNGAPLNIRTCADPDGGRADLVMTAESGVGEP